MSRSDQDQPAAAKRITAHTYACTRRDRVLVSIEEKKGKPPTAIQPHVWLPLDDTKPSNALNSAASHPKPNM
jgi:hypothetical protein